MRVLFCKFHCPSFVCFCKSPLSFYSSGPLKLETVEHVSSSISSVPDDVGQLCEEKAEVDKDMVDGEVRNFPKSSLKKAKSGKNEVEKGRVQWVDFLGKELVEIKEFEPSESEESEDNAVGSRGCVCVIQ